MADSGWFFVGARAVLDESSLAAGVAGDRGVWRLGIGSTLLLNLEADSAELGHNMDLFIDLSQDRVSGVRVGLVMV